jgi:hypothetical protein
VSIVFLWIITYLNNFLVPIIFPHRIQSLLSPLHPTFQEPDIQIDDAALDSWKHDQLENADALLTAAIHESQNPSHHVLASRALVRARLQQWDAALVDAEMVLVALLSHTLMLTLIYTKAIEIQPSVIGYIAKSIAHVGKGERHKGYQACDIAFEHFHSSHGTFILLIKVCIFQTWHPLAADIPQAIIVFMAGEHRDAISRVDDLIATVHLNSICYVVQARAQRATIRRISPLNFLQAYMYLLLGNSQMETSDFRLRYSRSSMHEPKCDTTRVEHSLWFHW